MLCWWLNSLIWNNISIFSPFLSFSHSYLYIWFVLFFVCYLVISFVCSFVLCFFCLFVLSSFLSFPLLSASVSLFINELSFLPFLLSSFHSFFMSYILCLSVCLSVCLSGWLYFFIDQFMYLSLNYFFCFSFPPPGWNGFFWTLASSAWVNDHTWAICINVHPRRFIQRERETERERER